MTIVGVGSFTRHQKETVRRVEVLRDSRMAGQALRKWLLSDVMTATPRKLYQSVREMHDHIRSMYPSRILPRFKDDNRPASLYRIKPPQWLDDLPIQALGERLEQGNSSVRIAGFVSAKPRRFRGSGGQMVADEITAKVASFVYEEGERYIIYQ